MNRKPASSLDLIIRMAALAMVLAIPGCVSAPEFSGTTLPSGRVNLDRLYVYSFLDLEADYLGSAMLKNLSQRLTAGLESRGVATEQYWFGDDPIASDFARVQGEGWTYERIPVERVIRGNATNERRFGAAYRLIAFPEESRVGQGSLYQYIRWVIMESGTQRVVWTTRSGSAHDWPERAGQEPSAQARLLVDGLIEQMDRSGLFRSAEGASPATPR